MSAALKPTWTVESFLAWERDQELRYEFDGSAAHAMVGGNVEHSVIGTNLVRALEDRLRGKPCRAFRGDLKIVVNGRIRYPDAMVTCSAVDQRSDIIPEPVVVFEVISPSTQRTDRIAKNHEYRATSSIQRYVLLEQGEMAATVFARIADDWVGRVVSGDVVLTMPEIGIELPLAALYAGVEFPPADSPG